GGLSLLLFILTFVREDGGKSFDSASFRHIPSLVSLLLMVVWGILIPVLGFLATSLIVFPLITLYLDRTASGKKKLSRIAIAEGLTIGFYLFFTRVLYVPFPEGILL
ncbi:MAG: tripartite tricarboxylate transporter TctB family protein, partial [Spirochaetaceae bacterium]|nr:tripartite tricarboxylate transporter TctB family protein [Spirochaetaceae bacterium]